MNIYQKIIILSGLAAFISTLFFFSPYNHIAYRGNNVELIVGTSYSSIFIPPNADAGLPFETKATGKYSKYLQDKGKPIETNRRQWTTEANTVKIDYPKLIVFVISIFIATTVLFVVFKNPKKV